LISHSSTNLRVQRQATRYKKCQVAAQEARGQK